MRHDRRKSGPESWAVRTQDTRYIDRGARTGQVVPPTLVNERGIVTPCVLMSIDLRLRYQSKQIWV